MRNTQGFLITIVSACIFIWYNTLCFYWAIQWLLVDPFELSIKLNMWHVFGLLLFVRLTVTTNTRNFSLEEHLSQVLGEEPFQMGQVKSLGHHILQVTIMVVVAYLIKDLI